jgi:hypothetical protein
MIKDFLDMITELPIEWDGFTAGERQRLKTRWSRVQFSPEFTAKFRGKISKGAPGESGFFFFEANDLHFFRDHFSGGIDFADLDQLVSSTEDLARRFYDALVTKGVLPAE